VSVKQSSAYCNVCQRQSLFQKPRINHVLHLILSIVTFGLWLFVWLILGIINAGKEPRCTTCGAAPGMGPIHAPQPPKVQPLAAPPHPNAEPMAGCRHCGAEFDSWDEAPAHAEEAHGQARTSEGATKLIQLY
jgi:hypothetical protein